MEGFSFNNTVIINTSLLQTVNSLGVFSVEDFNNWKNDKKIEEKGKTQTLDRTSHTDTSTYHGNHSNRSGYHNNNHSNGGGYHSNNHTDGPGDHRDVHADIIRPHSDNHTDTTTSTHSNHGDHRDTHRDRGLDGATHRDKFTDRINHTNKSTPNHTDSGHSNVSHLNFPHGNSVPHSNTGHSNSIPHSNSGHSNHRPHRNNGHNNTVHGNTGFSHDNYIPSKPHLFEVDELGNPKLIRDKTRIGLYSYDKNIDGDGTQDSQSKTVKFYMRIRKVKNLDGVNDVSPWKNLITNSTKDTYDLDTIDPLGVGNTDGKLTEGFYEIEAWATNDAKSQNRVSKTYESERKLVTVKIQQNIEPQITVANGDEFINFVFGPLGAADKDTGDYTLYEDNLYTEAPQDKREGIFVTVNMKDDDIDQWQRGNVYLVDEDNNKKGSTEVSIIWENGREIIDSNNTLKTGYAFISKDRYLDIDIEKAKLVLEITDYKDSECRERAGATIKQSTISKSDLRELTFSIDVTKPVADPPAVNASGPSSMTVSPNASDSNSGLRSNPYLYNRNGVDVGPWTNKDLTDTNLTPNTLYSYKYNVIDLAGNEKWSPIVRKYTLALNPNLVEVAGFNTSSITFKVTHDPSNTIVPDTKIILRKKGTSTIKSQSPWTKDINILVEGLAVGEEYDTYVKVRNEDEIENLEIKLSALGNPPLKDINGKPVDIITADKLPTVDLITDIDNRHYSESIGFNKIPINLSLRDLDINDILKVKYTLVKSNNTDLTGHTNKQIGEDTIANGLKQSFNNTITVDGTIPEDIYTLNIWAEDNRGGQSTVIEKAIIIDKSAPVPIFDPNGNEAWQRQHSTKVTITDPSNIVESKYIWTNSSSASILDSSWREFNTGDTLTLDSETGTWYLHIYTEDSLGNKNTLTSNSYSIDNEAPLVVFEPPSIDWTVDELNVKAATSDSNSGYKRIRYAWTRDETEPSQWSMWNSDKEAAASKSDEGIWYFHVQAEDNLGNTLTTYSGPYKYFEITPVNKDSFKIEDTTVDTMKVRFNTTVNQEYQLWLEDEGGTKIGTSQWIRTGEYTFKDIDLKPNTKYIPHIVTRRYDEEGMERIISTETEISNREIAYTNGEGISKARFVPGMDFIEIELAVETLRNPRDTEYLIKNDITGQIKIVSQSNPIWKNEGLSKEAEYEYSVKVIHKNGEESYFARITFENGLNHGKSAHTTIEDIEIPKDINDNPNSDNTVDTGNTNPGELVDWFDPDDMEGKYVQIKGETFMITKKQIVEVKTESPVTNATHYTIPHNYSGGYTIWNKLKPDNTFSDNVSFNTPGLYRISVIFKDEFGKKSSPIIKKYIADWTVPKIEATKKNQHQTAVTKDIFTIKLNAKDNISPWLFYSIDNGSSWYRISSDISEINFSNIQRSKDGVKNKLTIKVSDICGNVVESDFEVWGIQK